MAEMVQFNVRIERDLKLAGDEALRQAGYTPSQAVRLIWRHLAEGEASARSFLASLEREKIPARPPLGEAAAEVPQQIAKSPQDEDEWERKMRLVEEGRTLFEKGIAELGLTLDDFKEYADVPYEELMEEFMLERYEERGLL